VGPVDDLPELLVGAEVRVDGRAPLILNVPYDSDEGASCWRFGGRCEIGTAPLIELSDTISDGEVLPFEIVVTGTDDADAIANARRELARDLPRFYDLIRAMESTRFEVNRAA